MLGMAPFLLSCTKKNPPVLAPAEDQGEGSGSAQVPRITRASQSMLVGETELFELSLGLAQGGPAEVLVLIPRVRAPGAKFPLLLPLHGRGEAVKGPKRGARGWAEDYQLLAALDRIRKPPITDADYQGFSEAKRLAELNAELSQRPHQGLAIACAYLPDLNVRSEEELAPYAKFLAHTLIPTLRERFPILSDAESTGIDGVSLGGAMALYAGFAYPDTFGVVGSLQAAVQSADAELWVARAKAAKASCLGKSRAPQKIRLLTSAKDYFRDGIGQISAGLRKAEIEHEYRDVAGPHDYAFNRGPGCYELLDFHHRALKRNP
jgi:iron(III)-salmochelin esterase